MRYIVVITALLSLLLTPASANAEPPKKLQTVVEYLQLTQPQKVQIRKILDDRQNRQQTLARIRGVLRPDQQQRLNQLLQYERRHPRPKPPAGRNRRL